jgi:hypothetical protein
VTPRPGAFLLDRLRELAGRAGRASVLDAATADDLDSLARLAEYITRELDKHKRRLKGESAQHACDEEILAGTAAELERRRPTGAAVRAGEVKRPPSGPRPQVLTDDERHKVERVLGQFPDAGRPQIVQETGITEWRVRRFLEDRGASQAGEVLEGFQQVTGEVPSPGHRPG